MRRAPKKDANHPAIVERFQQWGATVADTAAMGEGFPDLVIGLAGIDQQVEVKDGGKSPSERRLSSGQIKHFTTWRGRQPVKVETLLDVDELCQRMLNERATGILGKV